MKNLLSLALMLIALLFHSFAVAQTQANPHTQIARASGKFKTDDVEINGYSTIQAAIGAPGTTGTVVVLPSYPGNDSWAHTNNVRGIEQRPYNPTNAGIYQNSYPAAPQTTLKAADFGAVCNGSNDDTVAINNALQALTGFMGGADSAARYMGPSAVELPQGRCVISSSLISTDYGSIVGSPGGTWLGPSEPWHGSDGALIILNTSYLSTSAHGAGPALLGAPNRQVRDISFYYNYTATAHTAIKVVSGYGHTRTTPYPSGNNNPQPYQIQQVSILYNNIFAMDTGIDLEDCGQCLVDGNYISFTRQGIWDNGNNYSLVTRDNSLILGSGAYTPTSGTVSGVISNSSPRWSCSGGKGSSCSGGTLSPIVASPQGLSIFGTTVEHWGVAGNFINALGVNIADGSCFCDSTKAVYINQNVGINFTGSTFSTSAATGGIAIEIAAPTGNPGKGLAQNNGWWIDGNSINTDNNSSGTATGIQLDSGTYPLVNLDLSHNQFFGFATAVKLNAPLTYSRITDNYGDANTVALINLAASGSKAYQSTVIANNTSRDSVPILLHTGTGYILGYNQSVSQLLGPQTVNTSGCAITAGAIGNECATPVTVTWPNSFADANYNVTCTGQGGTGPWTPATANIVDGSSFTINEIALSASATGGGALVCVGIHN